MSKWIGVARKHFIYEYRACLSCGGSAIILGNGTGKFCNQSSGSVMGTVAELVCSPCR